MRYRPPSKRGRPSFIPTPKPIAPRTAPPHVRNRRPHFRLHPSKIAPRTPQSAKRQTRRSKVQTPSAALTLVIKKVSPHDKKYFISRAQTFILVSANSANTPGTLLNQAKRLIIKRKRSKSQKPCIAKRPRRVYRYRTERHTPTERAPQPFPKKNHRPSSLPLF